ncbi:MAG: hypothetical protein ACXWLH_02090 [Candidatus Saccharimonadales bacterium]
MSSFKSQIKWVTKYFSSILLVLLVIYAGLAYFSSKVSVSNFSTVILVVVVAILLLTYYGLVGIRSALTFVVIAVVLLAGVIYSNRPKVNSGLYQSVTLTTGQTYFGHLVGVDKPNVTLKDAYIIQSVQQQSTTSTSKSTTPASTPVLVKLSTFIPGSEDQMVIKGDKIAYWSNLQDSSKVSQAINKDLSK